MAVYRGQRPRCSPLSLMSITALLSISSFNGVVASVEARRAASGDLSYDPGQGYAPAARQQTLQMAARRYLMGDVAEGFWDREQTEVDFYDEGRKLSATRHSRRLAGQELARTSTIPFARSSICFGKQFTLPKETSMDMSEVDISGLSGAEVAADGSSFWKSLQLLNKKSSEVGSKDSTRFANYEENEQILHVYVASEVNHLGMKMPRFSATPQTDQKQQAHSYAASTYHSKRTIFASDPARPLATKLALADVEVGQYDHYPTTVRVYDSVVGKDYYSRMVVDSKNREVPRMVVKANVLKPGAHVYIRRPDGTLSKHEVDGRNADLLVTRIGVSGSNGRADTYDITEMQSGRLLAKIRRQEVVSTKGDQRVSNDYSLKIMQKTDRAMIFAIMVAMDGLNHEGSRDRLIKTRATRYGGPSLQRAQSSADLFSAARERTPVFQRFKSHRFGRPGRQMAPPDLDFGENSAAPILPSNIGEERFFEESSVTFKDQQHFGRFGLQRAQSFSDMGPVAQGRTAAFRRFNSQGSGRAGIPAAQFVDEPEGGAQMHNGMFTGRSTTFRQRPATDNADTQLANADYSGPLLGIENGEVLDLNDASYDELNTTPPQLSNGMFTGRLKRSSAFLRKSAADVADIQAANGEDSGALQFEAERVQAKKPDKTPVDLVKLMNDRWFYDE